MVLIKLNLKKELYYSDILDKELSNFLNQDELFAGNVPEKNGITKSSSHLPSNTITSIPGFDSLFDTISETIYKTKFLFNKTDKRNLEFHRIWVNQMFQYSSGKVHVHEEDDDGVAIFYYKAPKQGGHFVVVDNEVFTEEKNSIDDYVDDYKSYVKVKDGDLIIHSSSLPHGVSVQHSDDSRICFVFNFRFSN